MFGLEPWLETLARGFTLSGLALLWVIVLVRAVGLRTFSKMTAFDFVVTLAVGSLLATAAAVTNWQAFFQATIAMAVLLFFQFLLARARKSSTAFRDVLENDPTMLMRDGEFVELALQRTRVSRADIMAKVRGANALDLSKVKAVVLETTGDISVLHGDEVDPKIIAGVEVPGRPEVTDERLRD